MRKNRVNSAGIVIIHPSLKKILMLRKNGKGDLPKGSIDEGETPFQAAIRECFEETNIIVPKNAFVATNGKDFNSVKFFVAVCDGDPKILPNPKSGKIEHDWVGWVSWQQAFKMIPDWMFPAVEYARLISFMLARK